MSLPSLVRCDVQSRCHFETIAAPPDANQCEAAGVNVAKKFGGCVPTRAEHEL